MNQNTGKSPFAHIRQEAEGRKKKSPMARSIEDTMDPALRTRAVQREQVRHPGRKRRKKIVNGRPVGKQIYFDEDVLDELTRRHEKEGLNVSFFVNKLVRDALNL